MSLQDHSVRCNSFAGMDEKLVSRFQLFYRDLFLSTSSFEDRNGSWLQVREPADRLGGSPSYAVLQESA
ncbi:MAG TPA: hypothetical protein VED17_03325, partial [Nitrososphaerales archaeon]|nr:hypothetical protein [Nitrososphaerales archaeon]